jgi:hypothetical protein
MAFRFGGDSGIRTPDLWIMMTETLIKASKINNLKSVCSKVCSTLLLIFGLRTACQQRQCIYKSLIHHLFVDGNTSLQTYLYVAKSYKCTD